MSGYSDFIALVTDNWLIQAALMVFFFVYNMVILSAAVGTLDKGYRAALLNMLLYLCNL